MLFNFDWLNDYLAYDVSAEEAAALLTTHAFEVASITERHNETVLEIEVLPNRGADCFSHLGISRELNAICSFLGKKKRVARRRSPALDLKAVKPSGSPPAWLNVTVENEADCDRYAMQYLTGVTVGRSPDWLTVRLRSLGVEPINNIVDIANYAMLDIGQPLHAFDADRLKDQRASVRIVVRRSQRGETVQALDGIAYHIPEGTLLVTEDGRVLALAGIKGAETGRITAATTNVLIESAHFDPGIIYQGSHAMKLATDASARFSVGLDPNLGPVGLSRASQLMAVMAGASPASLASPTRYAKASRPLDLYPTPVKPLVVALAPSSVTALAGASIPVVTIKKALTAIGCAVAPSSRKGVWRVTVPTYRRDLAIAEDLVEEVVRLFGYENIPSAMPEVALASSQVQAPSTWADVLVEAMRGVGFDEVMTYSLISESALNLAGLRAADWPKLKLRNPLSRQRSHLRPSLLPGLLSALAANLRYGPPLFLMEYGQVFLPGKQPEPAIVEEQHLAGLALDAPAPSRSFLPRGTEFYTVKGLLDAFFERLGISEREYDRPKNPGQIWHPGRVAAISLAGRLAGTLGELAPGLVHDLKLPGRAVFFELNAGPIIAALQNERSYKEPPRFPAIERDISLIVVADTPTSAILNSIGREGETLIENVALFDWYEDDSIGQGKKSLAFRLTYRSNSRTLTDAEVDQLHSHICETLRRELNAVIR